MLVFDHGYTDYGWFQKLTGQNVHFVTRPKGNAACLVLEERPITGEGIRVGRIVVLDKQANSKQRRSFAAFSMGMIATSAN